jgi:tRNA G18 (ribose-2'-O)-methylase SpoU
VLADRRYCVESLLLNAAAHRALATALALAEADLPVYLAPASVFEQLTGHDFHRGCLGIVRRPSACSFASVVEGARTLLVLEGVSNPDNIGAVFRSAAAFGADAVLLGPGSGDPLYRKAIRTSMASTLRVPFARFSESGPRWHEELGRLRERGIELVALTPREPALDLDEYRAHRAERPIALLLGEEGAGLSEPVLSLADCRVRIAIRSEIDSLNLAVAAGIALERLTAHRRARRDAS